MSGRRGEPIFSAPWPPVALAALILGGYAWQASLPLELNQQVQQIYGLAPRDLEQGRTIGLFTALLVHGNWAHAALNAVGAFTFGVPVARLFGQSPPRALAFFAFYVLCGVLASWGYALLHPGSEVVMVGASGAVSGLMGAAARLLEGRGRLGPVFSRTVVGMGAAWIAVNLLVGVVGFAPGSAGQAIAWEAHIVGFFAGVLLIGPWAALFARRPRPLVDDADPFAGTN
ncbi:rhomboid family intramembrane serine protease [Caulobacter sp. 17J80-11]|uniref:rhomboid family intramembrane serine protease n=1 Tax=Caulobacter sp. 17J80-11 TaxID=2763502 RepID=UPI00351C3F48